MPEIAGNEGGRILKKAGKMILDMLYPRRCTVCDRVLSMQEQYYCKNCTGTLRYIGKESCMKCGKPVDCQEEYCTDCKKKKTAFRSGHSVFLYDTSMRSSISRFKYHGRQEYAACYAREMYIRYGGWMKEIQAEALIPVPVHKERYRVRGFNQAELLAEHLSRLSGIPARKDILLRVKNTLPQKELTDKERLENLCQAFQITSLQEKLYKYWKCVIIIDDIYTTGSTVEACSRVLKNWGVEEIYFLCVCTGQSD